MKKSMKDTLTIGFAIFAVFFGAGNLIFPPWIGQAAGSAWFPAMIGLVITGIAMPILAVVAIGNGGGTFQKLTEPVTPWFYHFYNFFIMICLGLLITHPRVGAVAYETGIRTLLPNVNEAVLHPVALVVFFGLSAWFCINSAKVVDKVGQLLTPILLAALFKACFVAFIMLTFVYGGLEYLGATGGANFPSDTDQTVLLVGLVKMLGGSILMNVLSVCVIVACLTTSTGLKTVIYTK